MEKITLLFGDKFINDGDHLSFDDAQKRLRLSWPNDVNQLYTVIMYNMSTSAPPFMHWLIVNIPSDEVDMGQTELSYLAPTKPVTAADKYEIKVLYHFNNTPITNFKFGTRENFQVYELVGYYQLRQTASLTFYISDIEPKILKR